jgi:hypothetical protein
MAVLPGAGASSLSQASCGCTGGFVVRFWGGSDGEARSAEVNGRRMRGGRGPGCSGLMASPKKEMG